MIDTSSCVTVDDVLSKINTSLDISVNASVQGDKLVLTDDSGGVGTLKVKDQVYTNVTITSSSATDIYFTHSRGLASAKLRDLDPQLQKHFNYNAAQSAGIEKIQRSTGENPDTTLCAIRRAS